MQVGTGNRKRGDLIVRLEGQASPLTIAITSSVDALFGEHIREVVKQVVTELGITTGNLVIVDDQALDFVIRARIKAVAHEMKRGETE